MRARVFMRVGKAGSRSRKGYLVQAGLSPSYEPLSNSVGRYLPTAMFALDLDIPDEMFEQAQQVLAEIVVNPEDLAIAAEVHTPERS